MKSTDKIENFRKEIRTFYKHNRRDFPWRRTRDPYRILVSEVMLQQTQTARVVGKYKEFLRKFPSLRALASAADRDVVAAWQGLGYNRRAIYLKRCAEKAMQKHGGRMPKTRSELLALPGIGQSTAGAICAFAYGSPEVFIETNIRRAYIHFFFPRRERVPDADILPLVARTINEADPRNWHYALMDYGAALPRQVKNPNLRSAAYKPQSRFAGSRRELRGRIVRLLLDSPDLTIREVGKRLGSDPRLPSALADLVEEGLVARLSP